VAKARAKGRAYGWRGGRRQVGNRCLRAGAAARIVRAVASIGLTPPALPRGHQAGAVERLAHAPMTGLVMLGVFVYLPHPIEPGTGEDAPRSEHSGHHRVVLVGAFVHAVVAEAV
jgi:hypothetical protein